MRIPISKVWRAFPELDAFTDAECRIYVKSAARRRFWLLSSWKVVGLSVGGLVSMTLTLCGAVAIKAGLIDVPNTFWDSPLGMLIAGVSMLVVLLIPYVLLLVARDIVLKRLVTRRVSSASCSGCGYSMIGQNPYQDEELGEVVRCPECGLRTPVGDRGISRAHLMVGALEGNKVGGVKIPDVGMHDVHPLAMSYPVLRGLPNDAQAKAIEMVERTHPKRQRIAVGFGVLVAVFVGLAVAGITYAMFEPVLALARGWLSRGFWLRFSLFFGAVPAWVIGVWVKRILRGMLTRKDAGVAVKVSMAQRD